MERLLDHQLLDSLELVFVMALLSNLIQGFPVEGTFSSVNVCIALDVGTVVHQGKTALANDVFAVLYVKFLSSLTSLILHSFIIPARMEQEMCLPPTGIDRINKCWMNCVDSAWSKG